MKVKISPSAIVDKNAKKIDLEMNKFKRTILQFKNNIPSVKKKDFSKVDTTCQIETSRQKFETRNYIFEFYITHENVGRNTVPDLMRSKYDTRKLVF